jgi:hypothetical protein
VSDIGHSLPLIPDLCGGTYTLLLSEFTNSYHGYSWFDALPSLQEIEIVGTFAGEEQIIYRYDARSWVKVAACPRARLADDITMRYKVWHPDTGTLTEHSCSVPVLLLKRFAMPRLENNEYTFNSGAIVEAGGRVPADVLTAFKRTYLKIFLEDRTVRQESEAAIVKMLRQVYCGNESAARIRIREMITDEFFEQMLAAGIRQVTVDLVERSVEM